MADRAAPIQIHGMPDQRGPGFTYPAMAPRPETEEERERREASDAAYAKAIADGLTEKKARIEAARADALTRRVQMKLDAIPEDAAAYERLLAERKVRGKRLAKAKTPAARSASSVARRR